MHVCVCVCVCRCEYMCVCVCVCMCLCVHLLICKCKMYTQVTVQILFWVCNGQAGIFFVVFLFFFSFFYFSWGLLQINESKSKRTRLQWGKNLPVLQVKEKRISVKHIDRNCTISRNRLSIQTGNWNKTSEWRDHWTQNKVYQLKQKKKQKTAPKNPQCTWSTLCFARQHMLTVHPAQNFNLQWNLFSLRQT